MKFFAVALTIIPLVAANAFDTRVWLRKCEAFAPDVQVLRSEFAKFAAETDTPASRISIPVEVYPSGAVKTLLTALKAKFSLNSGYVWGEDVFLYQFHENGSTQAVLNASRCIVDKVKKTGWCEGHASAVYDNNYLEGCNVFLALDNEKFFLKIFEDAFAVVKNVKLDKSNDAKIDLESASAVYDREEGVIMFDKNVKLFESDRRISCDRAFAFLEGSNTLKRITAVGNVAFSDSSRTGGCPRADYDKSSGKLEMFSSASKTAFIEEFGKNKWKLEGRKIIFWLESEQVEVNNSVITAYDAGGDGKILEGFGR